MSQKPLQVLVVEDYEDTRTVLGMYLTSLGCEVALANDADSALDRIVEKEFDALLTDVFLPGRTGWDLVTELRGLGFLPPVTISMSAFFSATEAGLSRAYGCKEHLVKPFDPDRLARALGLAA